MLLVLEQQNEKEGNPSKFKTQFHKVQANLLFLQEIFQIKNNNNQL